MTFLTLSPLIASLKSTLVAQWLKPTITGTYHCPELCDFCDKIKALQSRTLTGSFPRCAGDFRSRGQRGISESKNTLQIMHEREWVSSFSINSLIQYQMYKSTNVLLSKRPVSIHLICMALPGELIFRWRCLGTSLRLKRRILGCRKDRFITYLY